MTPTIAGSADAVDGTESAPAPLLATPSGAAFLVLLTIGTASPLAYQGLISGLILLAVGLLPPVLLTVLREAFFRRLYLMALLWAGAQLISDYVHHAQVFSGAAAIGPISVVVASMLTWLTRSRIVRQESMVIAIGVGWLAITLLVRRDLLALDAWKFGLALPTTVLVLALLWRRRSSKLLLVGALLGLAAISFILDSRFYLGLHFGLAVLTLFLDRRKPGRLQPSKLGSTAVLLVFAIGAYLVYPPAALAGLLGPRAQAQQSLYEAEGVNFLVAQRPEMPQALYIVSQYPLLGIGSNEPLDVRTTAASIDFVASLGAPVDVNVRAHLSGADSGRNLGYGTHSSALDSAVHAGVLALGFWIYLFLAMIRTAAKARRGDPRKFVLACFLFGVTAWDALFSPLISIAYIQLALVWWLTAPDPSSAAWRKGITKAAPLPSPRHTRTARPGRL